DVVDHLSHNWKLWSIIVAGPGQEQLANTVASACLVKPAVLSGLSLKELTALLGQARLFVGNDSGPMHIAAAVGSPIVAVRGSSDPTVWQPWTEAPYRLVEAGSEDETGRGGDGAIKKITSRNVIAAVDEVVEAALEANDRAGLTDQAPQAEIDA